MPEYERILTAEEYQTILADTVQAIIDEDVKKDRKDDPMIDCFEFDTVVHELLIEELGAYTDASIVAAAIEGNDSVDTQRLQGASPQRAIDIIVTDLLFNEAQAYLRQHKDEIQQIYAIHLALSDLIINDTPIQTPSEAIYDFKQHAFEQQPTDVPPANRPEDTSTTQGEASANDSGASDADSETEADPLSHESFNELHIKGVTAIDHRSEETRIAILEWLETKNNLNFPDDYI